ncbi:hypothetical protein HN51_039144 [Arachis hypogaea]|nr:uncharacterized protein DS421_16g530200 [Arachis hypogaea]
MIMETSRVEGRRRGGAVAGSKACRPSSKQDREDEEEEEAAGDSAFEVSEGDSREASRVYGSSAAPYWQLYHYCTQAETATFSRFSMTTTKLFHTYLIKHQFQVFLKAA